MHLCTHLQICLHIYKSQYTRTSEYRFGIFFFYTFFLQFDYAHIDLNTHLQIPVHIHKSQYTFRDCLHIYKSDYTHTDWDTVTQLSTQIVKTEIMFMAPFEEMLTL